jgi:quinolinate synthase
MDTLPQRIDELKRRRNAVILAHNYQPDEIQAIADFTGDSLELSRKCAQLEADVIVFCGVWFMAETAAIMNPPIPSPMKVIPLRSPSRTGPLKPSTGTAEMLTR